jgi:hypothetical protein
MVTASVVDSRRRGNQRGRRIGQRAKGDEEFPMQAAGGPTPRREPVHRPADKVRTNERDYERQRAQRARRHQRNVPVMRQILRQPGQKDVLAVRQREVADIERPQRRTGDEQARRDRRLRGALLGLFGFRMRARGHRIAEVPGENPPQRGAGEADNAEHDEDVNRRAGRLQNKPGEEHTRCRPELRARLHEGRESAAPRPRRDRTRHRGDARRNVRRFERAEQNAEKGREP